MVGLTGKVVLVTGGNRGLGAAVVGLLQDLGSRVAYVNRSGPGRRGDLYISADVRDEKAIREAIERVENELGPIYGVIANAGVLADALFVNMTREEWREVLDTNLDGIYNTLRPLLPKMFERRQGAAVLVSSVVGERGNIGQANYSASKAAVIGLGKSLAREGARYGVRVNMVAPGFINTAMLSRVPQKIKEGILPDIPLRRFGEPEEVAWASAFLLSPVGATYITGQVLRVNGGYHM